MADILENRYFASLLGEKAQFLRADTHN